MATFTFIPIGKQENANIYVRLSIDRKNVFKRKTGFKINIKDWSDKKKEPIQRDESLKKLKINLDKLQTSLLENYNDSLAKKIHIDGFWLQSQIDLIHGKKKPDDPDRLVNHFETYIENLPRKRNSKKKNSKPITPATITKYKTILNKITAYEIYRKKTIHVKDVDLNFRTDFIKFLSEKEKLSENTIGRYITFVKTVCRDAKIYGIETNTQLEAFTGYSDEPYRIHLTFDEIEQIEQSNIFADALINARDWLIIGCYIGQRVSDLLILTKDNLVDKNGLELIELTQKKTGKTVFIPLHEKVKNILNKNNGSFPRKISAQRFNEYIKKVAEIAGISEPTKGAIIQEIQENDKKIFRKKEGVFPKYELVTSHICRRSFASNYYGEMPTPLIMTITGHGSEAQFLAYVGKPPIDHAEQIAEYLNLIYQKQQNKPRLEIRKAN